MLDAFSDARRWKRGTAPLVESRPDQNPSSPDLGVPVFEVISQLPPIPTAGIQTSPIAHTAVVDSLLAQNEDVVARLRASIRRAAQLESRILELNQENQRLEHENMHLLDQAYVLEEKDKSISARHQEIEAQHGALMNELNLLRAKSKAFDEISKIKNAALEGFVRRIRRWVRPQIDQLKSELKQERVRIRELEFQAEELRFLLSQKHFELRDLQSRHTDLQKFERSQEERFQSDLKSLVQTYEDRLNEQAGLVEKLRTDLNYFKERSQTLDAVTRARTEAENKLVLIERKHLDLQNRFNTEISEFQNQAEQYRSEAKALFLEVESLRADMGSLRKENAELEAQKAKHVDQIESMKILLSREQRSNVLEARPVSKEAEVLMPEKSGEAALKEEKLERIDSLLASLESGFPRATNPEVVRMRTLRVVDSDSEGSQESSPSV